MRITLLLVAGFLAIAGSGFFLLMRTIGKDIERQYSQASEEPLVDFAHLFASLLEQDLREGRLEVTRFREAFASAYRREFVAKIYDLRKTAIATHVYIADADGIILFDSDGGKAEGLDYSDYNDVHLAQRGRYGVRASRTDPKDSRSTIFYIAAPVRHEGRLVGTLTVSRPEKAMAPFVEQSRDLLVRSSLLTAAGVFLLAGLWSYWVLHPIRGLTRNARAVAEGRATRVPQSGLAELRSLSRALEAMRAELEGRHYVENYVRALTHELKSPLAAIRSAAELIDEKMPEEKRRRFLDLILAETTRSEDMVRRLLQLAALESRTDLAKNERFDLAALVREESAGLATAAGAREISVRLSGCGEDTEIKGDPLMMRIAVRNLIQNGIDFSPSGGIVDVELAHDGEAVELRVLDRGPGVPAYASARVFDRFYSLKNEFTGRKGSGIGLSLVRAAMDLHGGSARLENREGGGAVASLRIG